MEKFQNEIICQLSPNFYTIHAAEWGWPYAIILPIYLPLLIQFDFFISFTICKKCESLFWVEEQYWEQNLEFSAVKITIYIQLCFISLKFYSDFWYLWNVMK